ncbi:MAG: Trk family potassium uptake protein [Clostridia bacterium]|nr:Trk family potassium uptake protein [Clostridia bacterium]
MRKHRITTFQIIAAGFTAMILLGTLLLMLPVSSREQGSVAFSDCLFTATSAVCVTGLAVRDTATCWSPFGQAVILLMIQIGGLGVVTAAVSLAFLSGRRIGLLQRSVMQESIAAPQVGGIVRLTRFIVLVTLCIEMTGALLLLPFMAENFGWGKGVWYAVFHSVSAFCNAGFDLMGEREAFSSLTEFTGHVPVNIVLMLLITVGGIGFLVWDDLKEHRFRWKQFRLQSKVVLLTSAILVIVPAIWFFAFEMRDLSPGERILPSLFQSVTLRTAGFNTVDLTRISGSGQVLMIAMMLVGGSPGSTAGGMKTTTLAVLLVTAWNVFRRRDNVSLLGRRIGDDAVRSAVAILAMYGLLFFFSGVAISRIEGLPLPACLFETASAVGTVGLTQGITPELSLASRLILIALMFLGRVGGLTLIYAAQSVRRAQNSTLPLEKITVG